MKCWGYGSKNPFSFTFAPKSKKFVFSCLCCRGCHSILFSFYLRLFYKSANVFSVLLLIQLLSYLLVLSLSIFQLDLVRFSSIYLKMFVRMFAFRPSSTAKLFSSQWFSWLYRSEWIYFFIAFPVILPPIVIWIELIAYMSLNGTINRFIYKNIFLLWFKMHKNHFITMDLVWFTWIWIHIARYAYSFNSFSRVNRLNFGFQILNRVFSYYMMFKTLTA